MDAPRDARAELAVQPARILCTARVVAALNAHYDADTRRGVRLGEAADLDRVKLPFRLCFVQDLAAEVVPGWDSTRGEPLLLPLGASDTTSYVEQSVDMLGVVPATGTPYFLEPSRNMHAPDGLSRFISPYNPRWLRWQRLYASDRELAKLSALYEKLGYDTAPLHYFLRVQPVLWGLGGVRTRRQLLNPTLRTFVPMPLNPLLRGVPRSEAESLATLLGDQVYARWHIVPRPDGAAQARGVRGSSTFLARAADEKKFDPVLRKWRTGAQPRDPHDAANLNFSHNRGRTESHPVYWRGTLEPVPQSWTRHTPDLARRVWCPPQLYPAPERAATGEPRIWMPVTRGHARTCAPVPLYRAAHLFTEEFARGAGYFMSDDGKHAPVFDRAAWQRARDKAWKERTFRRVAAQLARTKDIVEAAGTPFESLNARLSQPLSMDEFKEEFYKWFNERQR